MISLRVRDDNNIPKFTAALRQQLIAGLERSGDTTLQKIESGFTTGQDALGRSWAPLDPATVAQKGSGSILVDTGAMRDSYTKQVNGGALSLSISTSSSYAMFHEFGTERMPSRPVLVPAAEYMERRVVPTELGDAIDRAAMIAGVSRTGFSGGDITDMAGGGVGLDIPGI